MKRVLMTVASAGFVGLALTLTGCGNSGIEEGLPSDTTPVLKPEDLKTNMSLPKGGLPKGSETGAPPAAKK